MHACVRVRMCKCVYMCACVCLCVCVNSKNCSSTTSDVHVGHCVSAALRSIPPLTLPTLHESGRVQSVLDLVLDGSAVAREQRQEGGAQLAQVVEHLEGHAHLGGVLRDEHVRGVHHRSVMPHPPR